MSFYHGQEPGHTPGVLSGPGPEHNDYVWWEAGALWGTMIDYWKHTGDTTYNNITQASLLFQVGPEHNYMPPNVSAFIGNDDQSFWGQSAMLAAETDFQNPRPTEPQWLALAQAVFNTQTDATRRDGSCGGGLRWQVFALNGGYDYKNAISNGLYFNLAARLARYTGDAAYARHAATTFDWMRGVGLVDDEFNVYDGAHVQHACRDINRAQFSYNVAVLLQGATFMYDLTWGEAVWAERVDGLLDSLLRTFFVAPADGVGGGGDGRGRLVAFEPACEGGTANVPASGCTQDMLAFKGFGARWMAATAQLCPWTRDRIMTVLRASAEAAVRQCSGGDNGRMCGMRWSTGSYDGTVGVGQEMNVLSALMVLLAEDPVDVSDQGGVLNEEMHGVGQSSYVPLTADTGGTSMGDPDAGGDPKSNDTELRPITDADIYGAAFLTSMVITLMFGVFFFMCTDAFEWPRLDMYSDRWEFQHQPQSELVFAKAPLAWADLEQGRQSRRASHVKTRPQDVRIPARSAKSRPALHQYRRATVYREDEDSEFGGDEASGVDNHRTRVVDRTLRLHKQSVITARGGCQRRDGRKMEQSKFSRWSFAWCARLVHS
ncbi:hypothetical protein Daus18300_007957 [Diaporthe australafricana]|uniref:mannan endo-1,6-alpha-mannosidase n=1 Tax=Diaporthe australafricana TaxID=127596 RepID=A0ABR3WKG2_9PEZI